MCPVTDEEAEAGMIVGGGWHPLPALPALSAVSPRSQIGLGLSFSLFLSLLPRDLVAPGDVVSVGWWDLSSIWKSFLAFFWLEAASREKKGLTSLEPTSKEEEASVFPREIV